MAYTKNEVEAKAFRNFIVNGGRIHKSWLYGFPVYWEEVKTKVKTIAFNIN